MTMCWLRDWTGLGIFCMTTSQYFRRKSFGQKNTIFPLLGIIKLTLTMVWISNLAKQELNLQFKMPGQTSGEFQWSLFVDLLVENSMRSNSIPIYEVIEKGNNIQAFSLRTIRMQNVLCFRRTEFFCFHIVFEWSCIIWLYFTSWLPASQTFSVLIKYSFFIKTVVMKNFLSPHGWTWFLNRFKIPLTVSDAWSQNTLSPGILGLCTTKSIQFELKVDTTSLKSLRV